ncbi:MAG TPA: hypothetical protein VFZ47_03045 [Chitinophagaceae bacterium]
MKGRVQFYDRAANCLVMDKEYIASAHPQENIYCCSQETLDCAINISQCMLLWTWMTPFL